LAARLIGCESGEMIIGRPAGKLAPFHRLELAAREFQGPFGQCGGVVNHIIAPTQLTTPRPEECACTRSVCVQANARGSRYHLAAAVERFSRSLGHARARSPRSVTHLNWPTDGSHNLVVDIGVTVQSAAATVEAAPGPLDCGTPAERMGPSSPPSQVGGGTIGTI
jgi:hypothetical protein